MTAQKPFPRLAAMACGPEATVLPDGVDGESESHSSTSPRRSIARSFIDWKRWSGTLARQRRMRRRTSPGTSGFSSSTGRGFSFRILCITSTSESAAKGRRRVAASYRMQPREKMSDR